MIKFLIFAIFHYFLNKLLLKKNFLIDKKESSEHKKKIYTQEKTPLAGGLMFISCLFITPVDPNYLFFISIIAFYILGLMSDLNLLSSPIKRIILQCSIVLVFLLNSELSIISLSWE